MGEVGGAPSGPPLGSAFVTAKAGMMQVVIVEVGAIRFCNAAARVSAVGAVVRRVVAKASGSLVPPARPGGLFAIATVCAKTPTSDSPRVRVSPVLHLVPPTCREVTCTRQTFSKFQCSTPPAETHNAPAVRNFRTLVSRQRHCCLGRNISAVLHFTSHSAGVRCPGQNSLANPGDKSQFQ